MSTAYEMDYTRSLQRRILWDETRTKAASLLASGYSKQYVADEVGVSRATIYNWLDDLEFAEEVDRLSIMIGIASRAQRLRYANKTVISRLNEDGSLQSDKDVLDWLKFAQSETDGAKIDLSKLAELLSGENGEAKSLPSQSLAVGAIEVEVSQPESSTVAEDESFNPS